MWVSSNSLARAVHFGLHGLEFASAALVTTFLAAGFGILSFDVIVHEQFANLVSFLAS